MAILKEEILKDESIEAIGRNMMIAARTAPKGRGKNTLELLLVTGRHISDLAEIMHELGDKTGAHFYHRDAENLKESKAILLLGTEIKTLGLNEACQLCGFSNCSEKDKFPNTPCVFNTGDLNLAIGSAVSIASDFKIDNRVMFTVGKAAIKAGLFEREIRIAYGIPLSATSKNPFFDRPTNSNLKK